MMQVGLQAAVWLWVEAPGRKLPGCRAAYVLNCNMLPVSTTAAQNPVTGTLHQQSFVLAYTRRESVHDNAAH